LYVALKKTYEPLKVSFLELISKGFFVLTDFFVFEFLMTWSDEILCSAVRAFYHGLRGFSNPSMTTERAIFFLHANPVRNEYSRRSLKIYLMRAEEVFIDFERQ
jgi:hypothetical protein